MFQSGSPFFLHWAVVFLLFVSTGAFASGDSCLLRSVPDPSYAHVELEVYRSSFPFLETSANSKKVKCDSAGCFSISLWTGESGMVYISAGFFRASLFVESDGEYLLKLPPYRKLSLQERMSPYFSPAQLELQSLNRENDLNIYLVRFESRFRHASEEVINKRRRGRNCMLDSLISSIEKDFSGVVHPWFEAHRQYRYGILAVNSGEKGLAYISEHYLGKEVREDHPAYMELFSMMYADFLFYFQQKPEGRGISYHINRTQNLDSLRMLVARHPSVSSQAMRDLILLQELPELFYRGEYHKQAILILLDSLAAHPAKASLGNIAAELRLSLASLVPGNEPPSFRLQNHDGHSYGPGDFQGKYTYLIFCTPENYSCMMEYPFLQSYLPKHSAYLEIICVMVCENSDGVRTFMEQNNYTFKALYYGNEGTLLDEYRVKAFPLAYLIGKDGKLVLSPAPLPSDEFEKRLFQLMRSRGEI